MTLYWTNGQVVVFETGRVLETNISFSDAVNTYKHARIWIK